jgi:hypothetical protein
MRVHGCVYVIAQFIVMLHIFSPSAASPVEPLAELAKGKASAVAKMEAPASEAICQAARDLSAAESLGDERAVLESIVRQLEEMQPAALVGAAMLPPGGCGAGGAAAGAGRGGAAPPRRGGEARGPSLRYGRRAGTDTPTHRPRCIRPAAAPLCR